MRNTLTLVLPCLVLCAATSFAQGQPTHPLALVSYEKNIPLRDQMIRDSSVYADLGGSLVARIEPATRSRLTRDRVRVQTVAEPGEGEELAAWFRAASSPPATGVRVLLQDGNLHLVSGAANALARLHQAGVFHGGLVRIPLDRAYVPATFTAPSLPAAKDARIVALVGKVVQANLVTHIKALSAIHTRRANQPENATAIKYVTDELKKLTKLTYKTHTFSSYYGPNVIAELKGLEKPNEIVMIGAHIDSLAGSSRNRAPGADDNASGSATVLELARIFSQLPMQRTVQFGWWNAEEYGLVGSRYYAAAARSRGDKIIAYLNTDMNAYRASNDTVDVDFVTNDSTASLITQLSAISKEYVPTLGVKQGSLRAGTSDHRSFYRNGYPAVFYFEDLDKYSPYIHTSRDDMVYSAIDMNLSKLITQSIAAGAATLADPLDQPSFQLSVTSGPTVGGTKVVASGSGLLSATTLKVAGQSVAFTPGTTIAFETPTSKLAGQVKVEITNPAGTGSTNFTYQVTSPPTLRLPPTLKRGATGTGAVGATPGHDAVTLIADVLGSTNLGFVVLDIGNGNAARLFILNVGRLSVGGGTHEFPLPVPNDPSLAGRSFHFQAGIVNPAPWGVTKTNKSTIQIQ